jgi:hypothetical protein
MPNMNTFLFAEFPGNLRVSLQPIIYKNVSLYGSLMPNIDTFLFAEFLGDLTIRL